MKIFARCTENTSPKCYQEFYTGSRPYNKNIETNNGRYICFHCKRILTHTGEANANKKYHFDTKYLANIDCEEKAYFLGMIASDGSVGKNQFSIGLNDRDIDVLQKLRSLLCEDFPFTYRKYTTKKGQAKTIVTLTINSKEMTEDICGHLKITPGRKCDSITFPEIDESLQIHFIRGYFDGDGSINSIIPRDDWPAPSVDITTYSDSVRESIVKYFNMPVYDDGESIQYWQNNAIDMMSKMYDDAKIYMNRKRDLYLRWASWVPGINGTYSRGLEFKAIKTEHIGVLPSKTRASDSGYDITLVKFIKKVGNLEYYTACIKVQPPFGYYFDMVSRSSMPKTGYILANGIGVIDRTYTGPLIACLIKEDISAPDLELPAKVLQIIPRQIVHLQISEEELDETDRGEKGFGSTGQ